MKKTIQEFRPVVILDDDRKALAGMSRLLESVGFEPIRCFDTVSSFMACLKDGAAAVILDLALSGARGQDVLLELRGSHPEIPVIVMTGVGGVRDAVECMKLGAADFITKGDEPERLVSSLRRVFDAGKRLECIVRLRDRVLDGRLENPEAFEDIITRDESMLSLFLYLEAIACTREPLLILGETGTGKELLAEAAHRASGRPGELVKINVAGLDDALFSDTLFGHRRGAFTGADEPRQGLIKRADGSSVLLDEIGDLGASSQIKLLRLIETGEFYAGGSDEVERGETRFILSTHDNLEEKVAAGTFRRDLYYRISVHKATVPPLRDRKGDIPLLVSAFLEGAVFKQGSTSYSPTPEDMARLAAYSFPGNVRELRSLVLDAAARGKLDTSNLPLTSTPAPRAAPVSFGPNLPSLREAEEALIAESLRRSGGNISAAARDLGISRQGLSKRLSHSTETPS